MAKNAIYSQAIIIEDRFTEKISHRQRKDKSLYCGCFKNICTDTAYTDYKRADEMWIYDCNL